MNVSLCLLQIRVLHNVHKKGTLKQTQWDKNRVLDTCSRVFSFVLVKRSLSIYMWSIQIDTKTLELVV